MVTTFYYRLFSTDFMINEKSIGKLIKLIYRLFTNESFLLYITIYCDYMNYTNYNP